MTQRQLKIKQPALRVSHQSEVLLLQRKLAEMEARLNALQKLQEISPDSPHAQPTAASKSRISLPIDGGYQFVIANDILYCEALGNYTKIYFCTSSDNKLPDHILISKTLKTTTALIARTDLFIRCHQSYLINKNHVVGFTQKKGLFAVLSNEIEISISRRNKKQVTEFCS